MRIDPRALTDGWRYAHGYYSTEKDGAMCPEGKLYNDGYMTVTVCHLKGDYADCSRCEYNPHYNDFVEVKNQKPSIPNYPKYHRSIDPIPTYCTDCKNKSVCKNITSGIAWCPDKVANS